MIYNILAALGVLVMIASCALGVFIWYTLRGLDDYED